ncbi:hypothetical protein [Moraxella catarrhalis]|nr:hypothetical protein [Moraxella catarrhalis]
MVQTWILHQKALIDSMNIVKSDNMYILEIEIPSECMHCFHNSIGDTIENFCKKNNLLYDYYEQYIDFGIGQIYFQDKAIKIIWEEFPNSISLFIRSYNDCLLIMDMIKNDFYQK